MKTSSEPILDRLVAKGLPLLLLPTAPRRVARSKPATPQAYSPFGDPPAYCDADLGRNAHGRAEPATPARCAEPLRLRKHFLFSLGNHTRPAEPKLSHAQSREQSTGTQKDFQDTFTLSFQFGFLACSGGVIAPGQLFLTPSPVSPASQ